MAKPYTPKIVTASDLRAGDVVYLTENDVWSRSLQEAQVLTDRARAEARLLDAEMWPLEVVGPYLADVTLTEDGPEPAHFREAFRATGPSNYPHGKQAQGKSL